VRVENTVPPLGNSTPSAENKAFRPFAIASPKKRPMIDAMTPTTSASSMTLRRTWRREPPMVRSVANSRMRCAIVIDSVFAITNAPTNKAMKPNASRIFWKIPTPSLTSSTASCVCAAAVFTFAVSGSSGRISAANFSGGTPGFAATWISSNFPFLLKRSWAVGTSKIAIVDAPIDDDEEKVAIPVISKTRDPWSAATPMVSPTAKCLFSDVLRSIAIWPLPTGHVPDVSLSGLNRASFLGSTLAAMLEPPLVEMTLPFRSISFASSFTMPAAAATSGSCFTFASTLSGNAGVVAVLLSLFLNATFPLITASAFSYDPSTTFVNDALIVSVRT
jgi:hypothetical protein